MQNAMNQISDKVFNANAPEIGAEMEQIRAEIAETGQVNPAAVLVGSSDVEATWAGMNISEKRAVVRQMMRITLRPPGCGCREPDLDQLLRIGWKVPAAA